MKKLFAVSMFLLSFALTSSAQTVNATYGVSGYNLTGRCVIPVITDNSIYYTAIVGDQSFSVRKLMLARTDLQGVMQNSIFVDSPYFYDHRIIATRDTGILLAARADSNLYVIKYNRSLTQLWSYRIPVGYSPFALLTSVAIETQFIDSINTEYFFITCKSATHNAGYTGTDVAFNVAKISGSGVLVFNRNYADANRSTNPADYISDNVNSIVAIDSAHSKFAISGSRMEIDSSVLTRYLFFIVINYNGGISTQYRRVATADEGPWYPELAWDPFKNRIVCAYSEHNLNNIVGNPSNTGGIGFVNLTSTLGVVAGRYYWESEYDPGNSITVLADGNYIIGSSTYTSNGGSGFYNPSFLKISSNTYSPMFYKRYNVLRSVNNSSFHRSDANDFQYMVPTVNSDTADVRVRLIKTDNAGNACGDTLYTIDTLVYTPVRTNFTYNAVKTTTKYTVSIPQHTVTTSRDTCTTANEIYYKVGSGINSKAAVSVYPNPVWGTGTLICELNLSVASNVDLQVFSITGQKILDKEYSLPEGNSKVQLPSEALGSGINILRVIANKEVIATIKVIVNK